MTANIQQMHIDTILLDIQAETPKQIFQHLTKHISKLIGTSEAFLLDNLIQREEKQNSGIGHGVAVLDAQLPRLTRPIIFYAKIINPVSYDAADGEPVDIVSLVLSPEFEGTKHLQRLAMVTRFFRDQDICMQLRDATTYEEIRNIVRQDNTIKKVA